MWSANADAWAFSLEVKASMVFLPVVAGMPGTFDSKGFLVVCGGEPVFYLAADWHGRVGIMWSKAIRDIWRYTGLAGVCIPRI